MKDELSGKIMTKFVGPRVDMVVKTKKQKTQENIS